MKPGIFAASPVNRRKTATRGRLSDDSWKETFKEGKKIKERKLPTVMVSCKCCHAWRLNQAPPTWMIGGGRRGLEGRGDVPAVPLVPHWRSGYKLIHSDNKSAARLLQHARRALAINQQIPSVMRGRWGRWGRRARRARGTATVILCNWQVGVIAMHRVPHSAHGRTVNRSLSWNVRAAAGWRDPFDLTRDKLLI